MPDEAFRRAPKSKNIEDRRGEFNELEHLLMVTGMRPPAAAVPEDQGLRDQYGLKPGEWLDYSDPELMPPLVGSLGVDLGGLELADEINLGRIRKLAGGK